jgi:hypothetical protein
VKLAVAVVVYQPEIRQIVRASVFLGNHVVHVQGHCQVNGSLGKKGWLSGTLRSFGARFLLPSGTSVPQNRLEYLPSGRDFFTQ